MNRRQGPLAQRRTVHAQVVDEIRQSILAGELQPGDRLRLDDLAARLGVSVMPVREALHQLTAEGTTTLNPYRGFSVSPLTPEEAVDLYGTRALLEGFAARLAVPRLAAEAHAQLRAAVQRMAEAHAAGDPTAFLQWDRTFHFVLYAASGRPLLTRQTIGLIESSVRYSRAHLPLPGAMGAALAEHRVIVQACERGDAALAEQLTRQHTEEVGARISRWLQQRHQAIGAEQVAASPPLARRPPSPAAAS